MSSAASIRSASVRSPAIRPASRVRACGYVRIAQLRPQRGIQHARSLGRGPPASARVQADERRGRRVGQAGDGVLQQQLLTVRREARRRRPHRRARRAGRRRPPARRRWRSPCPSVKSYCGATAVRAADRAAAVWTSLSNVTARGATMSRGARSPAWTLSDSWGRTSAPRIAVRTRIRIAGGDPEPRRVVPGEAAEGGGALRQHAIVPTGVPVSGSRRRAPRGPRAARALGHEAADDLAVGAAAGPRRQPAHDLAQVAGGGGARRGDALVHEGGDLGLGQGLREVLGQDVDLGLFLVGEVLAAAPSRRPPRTRGAS